VPERPNNRSSILQSPILAKKASGRRTLRGQKIMIGYP
jgi:hypothetical protein